MRKTLSLSFQPEIIKTLKENTKKYGFKSVNALIRFIATANIKIAVGIQK